LGTRLFGDPRSAPNVAFPDGGIELIQHGLPHGLFKELHSLADDIRRLEWQAYRKYAGFTQLVTVILSSDGGNFPKHEDELYGILYSTKLVH